MRNNIVELNSPLSIPELQVGTRCKRLICWARNIKRSHCTVAFMVLFVGAVFLTPGRVMQNLLARIEGSKVFLTLILVFGCIAVSLIWKTGQRVDVWIFKVFNLRGRRAPWVDKLMLGLTQFGTSVFALGLGAVFYFISRHLLAYEVILGTLTLWIVVEFIKILVNRKRPYSALEDIRIVGGRSGGTSFPSGHTSQSFFMAALLSHYFGFSFPGIVVFYIIASLIGITRIYVGMHYPRDVVGGAVFGTFWGLLGVAVNSVLG